MKIEINGKFIKPEKGNFNYSNIDSIYSCNTKYFLKNSKPYIIIAGEMHYSRTPKDRWKTTLLKMKALGLNTVTTYVFWNFHEENKNEFNFLGNCDIHAFLQVCKDVNMACVLRIGPWCHGEIVNGGLPTRIRKMKGVKTNDPKYLAEVKDWYTRLYQEIKDFMDGKVVIGIQIENEYNGPISHIKTLRKIVEDIGYKAPFFTMTAWPTGIPDNDFLPTFGGYPDAPWSNLKAPLKPNNRFAITSGRSQSEIGADLLDHKGEIKESVFANIPYASCEIGPGVQPTQHRRPRIREKDGYGVGFSKFASGMNWLGYYMFCGGSNPKDKLMQESKKTKYPNDYSIVDYDFQAPISRYGTVREHGKMLKNLHLFASTFDKNICTYMSYFPKWNPDPTNTSFLKCSIRMNNFGNGYFFVGNYEKALKLPTFNDVEVNINVDDIKVTLPKINVLSGSQFFYPFNYVIDDKKFDYILAEPITKENSKLYFKQIDGVPAIAKINNKEYNLDLGDNIIEGITIKLLNEKDARNLYVFNDKVYFIDGNVYEEDGIIYSEKFTDDRTNDVIVNKLNKKIKLPLDYYLYSKGKRSFYSITIPKDIIDNAYDAELTFDFDGLNLQVFSDDTFINDYFNVSKEFTMNIKDYIEYLKINNTLIIKTAPKTKHGVSNVYIEEDIPINGDNFKIKSLKIITKEKII